MENNITPPYKKITDVSFDRFVRVFVSSTFRDMMKERDYLVKNIFTELKKRCREIQVEFIEIDLRWGITEEETKQGKVLELCLNEIDKCKPYFIGILGGRYGYIPNAQDIENYILKNKKHTFLVDLINHNLSITEFEIQYGVLRNKDVKPYAYFYLRNDESTPSEFKESVNSIEYNKLIKLKDNLRKQTEYPVKLFSYLNELGDYILEDLWESIRERYPKDDVPDELTKLWLEHTGYAKSRLNLYIGGDQYLSDLNKLIENGNNPIIITGESGCGKSALISNWIYQYQKSHPDTFLLYHFIGGAPDSTDYIQLMLRIMKELKQRFNIDSDIPIDSHNIIDEFPNFLAQSGKYGNWILVIDAINQLENINNSLLLNWLPDKFPKFVKLILSVTEEKIENILKARNHSLISINPLTKFNSKNIVVEYLKSFGKALNEDNVDIISESKELNNPLLLRTFLDELRIFGEHEKLKDRIEYYTSNKDPIDFFIKIISRIELDTNIYYPNLLKTILSLICCSRKGLSENEILTIANIPLLYWITIKNFIETFIITRKSLIKFSHNYFEKAVYNKYLNINNFRDDIYSKLIDYFEKDHLSERSLDELPILLINSEQIEKLKKYLSDLNVFKNLYEKNKYELIKYWKYIENNYNIEEIIKESFIDYQINNSVKELDLSIYFLLVGNFLYDFGLFSSSLYYLTKHLDITKRIFGTNSNEYSDSLRAISAIYIKMGEYDKAIEILRESCFIIKSINGENNYSYASSLHNIGYIYYNKSEFEKSETIYLMALKIYKDLNLEKKFAYSAMMGNLGSYYQKIGKYEQAEQYLLQSERLKKIILGENNPIYANSLGNLGLFYFNKGEYQKAEDLYFKAIKIYKKTSSERNPDYVTSLVNLANLYVKVGKNEKAECYYSESLNTQKNVLGNEHPSYAISLNNLGVFYYNIGKLEEAELLYKNALNIYKIKFNEEHHEYITTLGNLATLYMKINKNDDAEMILKESIELLKQKFGEGHSEYARSIYNLGMLYFSLQDFNRVEPLFLESLNVYSKSLGSNNVDYITVLINYANFCKIIGNNDKAESLYLESLKLQKNIYGSINSNLAVNMNNLGVFYYESGNYDKAKPLYLEALDMNQKLYGEYSNESFNTMLNIFYLYYKIKDLKNVKLYYDKILELRKNLPPNMKNSFESKFRNLDKLYKSTKIAMKIGSFIDKFFGKKK